MQYCQPYPGNPNHPKYVAVCEQSSPQQATLEPVADGGFAVFTATGDG
jgi:hypothetical protein